LVSPGRPAPGSRRTFAHRGHHAPSHARLFRRSATRLRWRIVSRRGCGRRDGGNLSGSICRNRGAFRSGLWGCRRSYLRIRRDAARLSKPSAPDDTSAVPRDRPSLPTIVFHGDRDTIVHPRNADHVITRSMRATNWQTKVRRGQVPGGHAYTCTIHTDANGQAILEQWCIHGAGHAWSGGSPAGSYTDPRGPDAAKEMLRFFRDHPAARTRYRGCEL
jgi:hypothetical protein